jgi:urease accessory protein
MRIYGRRLQAGGGLAAVVLRRAPSVTLDWDARQRSRLQACTSLGESIAIFLPRGKVLRGGDVLVGEDGSIVQVRAALQPVMCVRSCALHADPTSLVRAAYHLGNRHVPVDVRADHLRIEPDAVLADMLRGMHLDVDSGEHDFEPQGGAYHVHGDVKGHEQHAHSRGPHHRQGVDSAAAGAGAGDQAAS